MVPLTLERPVYPDSVMLRVVSVFFKLKKTRPSDVETPPGDGEKRWIGWGEETRWKLLFLHIIVHLLYILYQILSVIATAI